MAFNKVILVGNLTADPELKQTPSGVSVATFTLAVQRRYAKPDDAQQADFINIVAWRQQAEFVSRYFTKGSPMLVCGAIQTRNFTDQSGQKRSETVANVNEVNFCGNRAEKPAAEQRPKLPYGAEKEPIAQPSMPDFSVGDNMEPLKPGDDLPF
jgi:single-strand DNA-binding protein